MNDEQIRFTALVEMFIGLGQEPAPERTAYYVRLTKNVPTEWFRVACDHAVCASTSGFPPSPGEIIAQAERLHRERVVRESKQRAQAQWDEHVAEIEDPDAIGKLIDGALAKFDA